MTSDYQLKFREKLSESSQEPFATGRLRVAVLDNCNMNCSYCYNEGMSCIENKSISPSDLEFILGAIGKKVKAIKLVGGEPLIHPEISELMEVSKRYAPTSITTNGTFLEKYAKDIIRYDLEGVTVSIDDTNPARFRTLTDTKPETYQKILWGIDSLINSGYDCSKISINAVVSSENLPNLKNIIDFAEATGIKKVNFMNLIKVDCINPSAIVDPEKIDDLISSISQSSEYVIGSRHRHKVGNISADVIWQYCNLGCDFCRIEGFIRVTPSYEFKYCVSSDGVSFADELKNRDKSGILKKFEKAVSLMGTAPHRAN